jgi:hypothetical protein
MLQSEVAKRCLHLRSAWTSHMKGFRRLGIALPALSLAVASSCHHRAAYVEPPPRWHWADVGKSCDQHSPTPSIPAAARDSLGHPFGTPGTQDPWATRAALAPKIPGGWGGLASQRPGPFGIYLVDTTQRSAALAALLAAGVQYISDSTKAVQGRWTYDQLYDWFRYIHSHLYHVGVNMWALDEWRNRIHYGTLDEAAAAELNRQLTALNVPCFLVVVEVIGPIHV